MNNYFFIDGPALLGDLKRARDRKNVPLKARLDLRLLATCFLDMVRRTGFTNGGYRRFAYYFASGDPRLARDCIIPQFTTPYAVNDLAIVECGKRLDAKAREAQEWLSENDAPQWVVERLGRTEKAVDTQICCDALQLAAVNKIDRLFLYTNDYDFVPLCRVLRNLGININLIRMSTADEVNEELVRGMDGFTVAEAHESFSKVFVSDENLTLPQ